MAAHFCGNCGAPNAATATFCGRCGRPLAHAAAVRPAPAPAAQTQPAAAQAPPPSAPIQPAYMARPPVVVSPHKPRPPWLWITAIGTVFAAAIILGVVAYALRPQPSHCTGVNCTKGPPQSKALAAPATFTSSTFGYRVEYFPQDTPNVKNDSSIAWSGSYTNGESFEYGFTGDHANGRSPQEIVQSVQQSKFPGATLTYALPMSTLGYTPGYGAVYDLFASGGQSAHERVMIVVAIKGDVAVIFTGLGPQREASPGTDGHPNPADVSFVHDSQYLETTENVLWPGEPPL